MVFGALAQTPQGFLSKLQIAPYVWGLKVLALWLSALVLYTCASSVGPSRTDVCSKLGVGAMRWEILAFGGLNSLREAAAPIRLILNPKHPFQAAMIRFCLNILLKCQMVVTVTQQAPVGLSRHDSRHIGTAYRQNSNEK